MEKLKLNVRVTTDKGTGEVAYIGKTKFKEGDWVGIILDEPNGKNNGTVEGETYFKCKDLHGIFVKPTQVRVTADPTPGMSRQKSQTSGLKPPSSAKRTGLPRPSPAGTPKISPTPSSENLAKAASRKSSSSADTRASQLPTSAETSKESRHDSVSSTVNDGESVRDKAQKFAEPQTPIIAQRQRSVDPAEQSEVNALRAENSDLKERLEVLRQKSKQEHLELERAKIQLQQLTEFKNEITEAHAALKRTLEERQKELEEARSKAVESTDSGDFMEQLEMVTLDKEMAEERAELLSAELEQLKARNQELETDLELLKAEMQNAGSEGDAAPVGNSIQLKHLEAQIERYKEAIVRLRDLTARTNTENNELKKQMEQLQEENEAFAADYERLQRELAQAEEAMNNFREQVDSAMGSERMIEILTEKNLDLEEKLRTAEETIEDFEQIRAMDDELMETQKDLEKDLRKELELHFVAASELKGQIRKWEERAEEYEKVILKFRQRISDLNEEIQTQKDEVLILKSRLEHHDADHGGATSVSLNRGFEEIVDAEMRKIELEFAQQHAKYLRMFLPDNFNKAGGDYDSVLLMVTFPRMAAKTVALRQLLALKFPSVPGGMRREHITKSHRAEQWAHVQKFNYCLVSIEGIVLKVDSVLKNCSVERLSRLSTQQLEIANQEKSLDLFFELLKQSRLDENTSTDNLDRIVNFFEKMYSVNLTAEVFDTQGAMSSSIQRFLQGVAWMQLNCQRLKFFQKTDDEDGDDIGQLVDRVLAVLSDAESSGRRALKLVPEDKDLLFSPELNDEMYSASSSLERAAKILHSACSSAAQRLTVNDVDGFTSAELKEMIQNAVEKLVGVMEPEKACDCIVENVKAFHQTVSELTKKLDNGHLEVPLVQKKQYPPLVDRAHVRKTDAVEAEGLRWQISKKEGEIIELKKALKAKNDDISSLKVRIDMADKNMESSGKSGDAQVKHLKAKNDELMEELRKKEEEHTKAVEELQAKLEGTQKENTILMERAKDFSKKALFANMSNAIGSPISPSASDANRGFAGDAGLERAYQSTLDELKWARHRIWKLEAEESGRILASLKPLNAPDAVCGLYSLNQRENNEELSELEKMSSQAEQLVVESNRYLTEPVDPIKKVAYQNRVRDFNLRVEMLKFKFERFWNRTHPGEAYPRLLGRLKAVSEPSNVVQTDRTQAEEAEDIVAKWNRETAAFEQQLGRRIAV